MTVPLLVFSELSVVDSLSPTQCSQVIISDCFFHGSIRLCFLSSPAIALWYAVLVVSGRRDNIAKSKEQSSAVGVLPLPVSVASSSAFPAVFIRFVQLRIPRLVWVHFARVSVRFHVAHFVHPF